MTEPAARRSDHGSRLYRYEVRIRTSIAPALASSFADAVHGGVVHGHEVRRLAVIREDDDVVDLPAVVQRLTECDVAVLDVRVCHPPTAEPGSLR